MTYLLILPVLYFFVLLCWLLYIGVMNLARVRDQLGPVARFFGYQILAVGLVANYLLTTIVGSVLFLDPSVTDRGLTERLHRTQDYWPADHWRHKLARYICRELLDALDPTGDHC